MYCSSRFFKALISRARSSATRSGFSSSAFFLRDDPHETKNALDENPERVAELRALLIDALKNREEGYIDGHNLLVGKTPVTVLQHTEVL